MKVNQLYNVISTALIVIVRAWLALHLTKICKHLRSALTIQFIKHAVHFGRGVQSGVRPKRSRVVSTHT